MILVPAVLTPLDTPTRTPGVVDPDPVMPPAATRPVLADTSASAGIPASDLADVGTLLRSAPKEIPMTKLALMATLLASVALIQTQEKEQPAGPAVGQPAPTLRLNDHEGKAVALGGKAKRWTVLAFFPKALTGG